jgi:CheY-like chemotaxis protein/two-component sensor histidine kinase
MKKILIVEDQLALVEEIIDWLTFEGFEATPAYNGREAIESVKVQKPDLILCDIMMPEMDGYELLSSIQEDPETCLIPVIMMTALVEPENQRTSMKLGADDFIRKPFRKDDLLQAIESRLKKLRSRELHLGKEMDQFKKTITLNIPHELLTPLNGILGFSELLSNGASTLQPDQIRKMADNINISGNRLFLVIQHFIAYLNLLRKNPSEFDNTSVQYPNDIINSIAAELGKSYKRPNDLLIDLKGNECRIGKKEFTMLIRELADNAYKFSKKGMPVTIKSEISDHRVFFSFHNYGSIFPLEQVGKIGAFVQFERAKFEQQGLGLGLAIVQLILNHYQGSLEINSDLETGTLVTISLPE